MFCFDHKADARILWSVHLVCFMCGLATIWILWRLSQGFSRWRVKGFSMTELRAPPRPCCSSGIKKDIKKEPTTRAACRFGSFCWFTLAFQTRHRVDHQFPSKSSGCNMAFATQSTSKLNLLNAHHFLLQQGASLPRLSRSAPEFMKNLVCPNPVGTQSLPCALWAQPSPSGWSITVSGLMFFHSWSAEFMLRRAEDGSNVGQNQISKNLGIPSRVTKYNFVPCNLQHMLQQGLKVGNSIENFQGKPVRAGLCFLAPATKSHNPYPKP